MNIIQISIGSMQRIQLKDIIYIIHVEAMQYVWSDMGV